MQAFGNVATKPERKESKSGKTYWQFRVCESQRGVDDSPTWYTVRIMKGEDPKLTQGDFVKVTGKLKADFYLSREGKPTGTLLIIAFEASMIAKPSQGVVSQSGEAEQTAVAAASQGPSTKVAAKPEGERSSAHVSNVVPERSLRDAELVMSDSDFFPW